MKKAEMYLSRKVSKFLHEKTLGEVLEFLQKAAEEKGLPKYGKTPKYLDGWEFRYVYDLLQRVAISDVDTNDVRFLSIPHIHEEYHDDKILTLIYPTVEKYFKTTIHVIGTHHRTSYAVISKDFLLEKITKGLPEELVRFVAEPLEIIAANENPTDGYRGPNVYIDVRIIYPYSEDLLMFLLDVTAWLLSNALEEEEQC